ncbi:hypothetical protein L207DRAFT_593863 [Hyaloscypha variabilis F]|uniref:Uncharacterized protein n=1 Tax=Hyaloscypha variabilis (strain UAMH 11265 / GT02V1 / F) TaxID=1149755 RepID=A0A2J6QRV9_HYAVF|nr:hypothetical protein L207DRAFT_593863 [Hyaloscypha variabilis F]
MADESNPTPNSPPPQYAESAPSASAYPPRPTVHDEFDEPLPEPSNPTKPPLPPRIPTSSSISSSSHAPPPRSPTQPSPSSPMSRKPVPAPKRQPTLLETAKGALPTSFSGAKDSALKYGKFVLEHVKKGEMPWTQWYCCGVVGGSEVRSTFFHFFQ